MDPKKSERFWQAATEGNLPLVQLLSQDPEVNIHWQDEEHQRTPIFRACGHGRTEVVRFLLGLPESMVNLPQKEGATPFSIGCQEGYVGVVKLLLNDDRVALNQPDNHGRSPFHMACQNGRADVISLLLSEPRIDPHKPSTDETTPFNIACQQGHLRVVLLLLADERVDCDLPRSDETTPLWFAAQNGHLSVVQHILASGREVNTKKISHFNNKAAAAHARSLANRAARPDNEIEEIFLRRKVNGALIADLIDAYDADPITIRAQLRKELEIDSKAFPFSF